MNWEPGSRSATRNPRRRLDFEIELKEIPDTFGEFKIRNELQK